MCSLYLFSFSVLTGMIFTPEASIPMGLILPFIYVLVGIIGAFGLVEVGETILDPFGDDPEDYALLHFVEVTVCASHEAIEIERCGPRVRERETFYESKELNAANAIVRRMIKTYRWKKLLKLAEAQEELDRAKEEQKEAKLKRTRVEFLKQKTFASQFKKGIGNVAHEHVEAPNESCLVTPPSDNSAKIAADGAKRSNLPKRQRRKSHAVKSEHPGRMVEGSVIAISSPSPSTSPNPSPAHAMFTTGTRTATPAIPPDLTPATEEALRIEINTQGGNTHGIQFVDAEQLERDSGQDSEAARRLNTIQRQLDA